MRGKFGECVCIFADFLLGRTGEAFCKLIGQTDLMRDFRFYRGDLVCAVLGGQVGDLGIALLELFGEGCDLICVLFSHRQARDSPRTSLLSRQQQIS